MMSKLDISLWLWFALKIRFAFLSLRFALKIRFVCKHDLPSCVSSDLSVSLSTNFAVFKRASGEDTQWWYPFLAQVTFLPFLLKQLSMISLFGSSNFFAAPFFEAVDKGKRRCGNVTDPLFRWSSTISTLDHQLYLISSLSSHVKSNGSVKPNSLKKNNKPAIFCNLMMSQSCECVQY